MISWQFWLIVAGICFIIEIITVGFLIFWLAIAALVVALLSLFIHNFIAQSAIFICLSSHQKHSLHFYFIYCTFKCRYCIKLP